MSDKEEKEKKEKSLKQKKLDYMIEMEKQEKEKDNSKDSDQDQQPETKEPKEEWRKDTVWEKPKRTRTIKGRYKADDKSTPDVNEAWEGGKAPKKKKINVTRRKAKQK